MSQSEVFRPSTGPLQVRNNLSHGVAVPIDVFRKRSAAALSGSRPGTQGGYRFGQLSHNSFFARHNPQPGRVRHIKGLLDVPICAVNDSGYFANPRYSLNFPPNNHDQTKLSKYPGTPAAGGRPASVAGSLAGGTPAPAGGAGSFAVGASMPVNAINVNSTKHPINAITGLQSFLGNPLNFRVFREKAVPRVGMVPVTEAWRDELRALTEAVGLAPGNQLPRPPAVKPGTAQEAGRPRTSQYSQETGRLIPPPSRAMSRGQSRAASRAGFMNKLQHITEDPDYENVILSMLCQILQTDDVNAVQSWLVSAGDREKALVLDMIKSAISNNEQYYKQGPAEYIDERPRTGMAQNAASNPVGEFLGGDDKADRLTLDGGSPPPRPPTIGLKPFQDTIPEEEDTKPLLPDVFRKPGSAMARPVSGASRPRTPGKPGASPAALLTAEAKLRYTTTPIREPDYNGGPTSFLDDDKVWQPDLSV